MIDRICIIVNSNAYETKRYYSQCFTHALRATGVEILTIDIAGKPFEVEHYQQLLGFQPQLTCSFNSIRAASDGSFLWDYSKIPHWLINLDPIVYNLHLLESPYSIVSCVDRWESEWLRENWDFDRGFFFPHAADKSELLPEEEPLFDVVLIGSCYDHEAIRRRWPEQFTQEQCQAMEEAVDRVLADHCTPFIPAVEMSFARRGLEIEVERFREICFAVDYYLRGKDRLALVNAVEGADVHIFGAIHKDTDDGSGGWSQYLADNPRVKVHGPLPFEDSLAVLQRSKICLNSVPSFKDGTHVRLFTGPLAGSLVVTNDSLWVREEFPEEVISYQHGQWDLLNEQIQTYLGDEERRRAAVEGARRKILKSHTWDVRAVQMQELLSPMVERIAQER